MNNPRHGAVIANGHPNGDVVRFDGAPRKAPR
jgi:hypothetical protein